MINKRGMQWVTIMTLIAVVLLFVIVLIIVGKILNV